MSNRIKPLAKDVVNRIAAGEIIVAPSNALKELLENSVDAGATQIDVLTKNGGLKLLQIIDNGCGIDREDLPILCERFTTSKLKTFEDLKAISTFGFRGEALASISHVARLSVITKTKDSNCAWKAHYLDGNVVDGCESGIQPVAGKDGTVLVVEDLFYNIPSRLRALKSSSEEYSKIVDVVSKYSIHINDVGFCCQRQDGRGGKPTVDVMVRKGMKRKDRIRNIYGSNVANNLLELDIDPLEDYGLAKCQCSITNTNFDNKKSIAPVVFINNRLVVCDPLRRAINSIYAAYLPKGHKPFIYISMEIQPENLDVNVHPTKREVRFLNEDEIIDHIALSIDTHLASLDTSRKFMTQQVLTHKTEIGDEDVPIIKKPKLNVKKIQDFKPIDQMKKLYEHQMVRTDFSQTTLNTFVKSQVPEQSHVQGDSILVDNGTTLFVPEDEEVLDVDNSTLGTSIQVVERSAVNLISIKELRREVETNMSKELTHLFAQHIFVGIADYTRRLCCIQYDVNLYLVDFGAVLAELFYQIGLADFANFGKIEIEGGVDIKGLITSEIFGNEQLMDGMEPLGDEELGTLVVERFLDMSDMWGEYFNIEIEDRDGTVMMNTMPLLISGYIPPWSKLSLFLWRVINGVNWEDEKKCLAGVLRQLALFHVPASQKAADADTLDHVENVLFPAIKKRFIATDNLTGDIVEIANLPGLYKVFERC